MLIDRIELIWILLILIPIVFVLYLLKKNKEAYEDKVSLDKMIESAGYAYDPKQDVFYSRADAWQRKFGYNQFYDEAAAPLGMIIDCEPIRFEYDNRKWLIQMWKGQYGMTMGCEVGVYATRDSDNFYDCVNDEDQLYIAFILRKNRKIVFSREGIHWWLTGFKLGEFSEPDQLTMDVRITLKDRSMCNAFVTELYRMGYAGNKIRVIGTTVWIYYDQPYSPQPLSRTPLTQRIMQIKNKGLCDQYQDITQGYSTTPEKIAVIKAKAPELYSIITNMGRSAPLFHEHVRI